jgi:hypothetical protein
VVMGLITQALECFPNCEEEEMAGLLCSRTALLLVQVLAALLTPIHEVPTTRRSSPHCTAMVACLAFLLPWYPSVGSALQDCAAVA